MIYSFQNVQNSRIFWNLVLTEIHCNTSVEINTVLQMTFSTAKLIVPLSSFSSIGRIWIPCPHLHVTSAGFICFKVTRVAYMYFNVADRNSFLMMYLLGSTMHIHSALGETWNLNDIPLLSVRVFSHTVFQILYRQYESS